MALDHTVTRHEHRKNPQDGTDEIFINIETMDDDGEMSNHGRWLAPTEVAEILEEEKHGKSDKKDAIHAKYIKHAAAQHPKKVADRLQVAEEAKNAGRIEAQKEADDRALSLVQARAAVVQAQLQLAQLAITNPEAVETAAVALRAAPVSKESN